MKDYSKYKLDIKPSPYDPRDWRVSAIIKGVDLPEVLDYRPLMQPVRDQGYQGSCAAMASSSMKEVQEKKDIGLNEYLSPQFIYNNREDKTEEGMYTRDLLKILQTVGVCKETLYPYGSMDTPSYICYKDSLNRTIDHYARVESWDQLRTSLYVNGPCLIAVPVYNYGSRMWYQNPGEQLLGGHMMCIAGYVDDDAIIRNSWSEEWELDGYTYMNKNDFSMAWEYWTTIDAKSVEDEELKERKGCALWWYNIFGRK